MKSMPFVRLALVLPPLLLGAAATIAHGQPPTDVASFEAVDRALDARQITDEQALLLKLQHVFEPEAIPVALRSGGIVRCVTPLLARYHASRNHFSPRTRALVDGYLAPRAQSKTTYLSPGGNFELSYTTTGADAVPPLDINPIDGIPDFVQRVAEYCDESWQKEILELGFTAPALGGGRYQISFANIGAYGYTSVNGSAPGGTVIVVHHDFSGFPPNTDPDGNVLGAAKVTVAHELKHAIQYVTSQWSEGDWVELDATWMEDLVYDDTNDYYNYLGSGSPISTPTMALDAGGGGSYEDCVWQHYLSETYGNSFVVDFWAWRSSHQGQSVLGSYDAILQSYGRSLVQDWPVFAAWNYATGGRAVAGLGYGEASSYPTAPVATSLSTYPATDQGTLGKLSAAFVRCLGLNGGLGHVEVSFSRAAGSKLELTAVITRTDGMAVIERVPLTGDVANAVALSTPLELIDSLGLAVSNSATDGAMKAWDLTVDVVAQPPPPAAAVSASALALSVEAGATGQTTFELSNVGAMGSILQYRTLVMQSLPAKANKSVAGSTVDAADPTYEAGSTLDLEFTVTNASPDEEWLTDVTLTFPPGVTVNASTDFVGGSEGTLVSDGATGDGATVHWSDGNGGFGNVYGSGEQATATVNLTFDTALTGPLTVEYTIVGDLWGADPHSVVGSLALSPLPDGLDLTSPDGGQLVAVGDTVDIIWTSTGELTQVRLELSRDGGATWETLLAATPNDGQAPWTVTGPATTEAVVRIASLDETISDVSRSTGWIYDPVPWAALDPTSGSIDEGASATLTLSVDAALLAEGAHDAVIVLLHDGPASPIVLPLELTVTEALTASPHGARAAFRLEGNFPNPFNPTTQIRFQLAREERISLSVYNAAGQHVRTVLERRLPAGSHTAVWNGCDDAGRPVASGVYWARLQTPATSDVRGMVLVR